MVNSQINNEKSFKSITQYNNKFDGMFENIKRL